MRSGPHALLAWTRVIDGLVNLLVDVRVDRLCNLDLYSVTDTLQTHPDGRR